MSERFPGSLTGVHFSQTVPWLHDTDVRVTDVMSVNLLGLFESERIKIPAEAQLRASLQLPERSGKASGILYTPRSAAGHADDFWSLALAAWSAPPTRRHSNGTRSRQKLVCARQLYKLFAI